MSGVPCGIRILFYVAVFRLLRALVGWNDGLMDLM